MNNALQIGKKAFTWSVVVLTILWSMGIAALVPLVAKAASCPTLNPGDLFKVTGNSAVYLLNANAQRLYFPHSTIYKSWYKDYSGIVEIAPTCVDAYPAPTVAPFGVNFRPGSKLVKVMISPTVYAVEPGNKLAKIGSEAVAKALYGNNWASQVMDVADVFFPNYANRGSDITESVPHDGMLIKVSGSNTVYYVSDGKKFTVDGTVSTDVRTVAQSVVDAVPAGTGSVTVASIWSNPSQGVGGTATTTTPPPVPGAAGTLTISLASDTPNGTYAVSSAARVPFTKVNFTAGSTDVVIDSMKVIRVGNPAKNTDFATINAIDSNGNLLNDTGKTLNSDNYATFTEDITIPANTTKTYTFVGDMGTSVGTGDVPVLQLDSLVTNGTVTVSGLPVKGNPVSMNGNITLGSVTLAEGTVVGSITKEVGALNVNVASLKISVATNDFQVGRIVLYNSSTAADADVGNYVMKYNGNQVAKGTMKNKYVTFDLSSCTTDCLIAKSSNKNFDVYADIVGGSGRTLKLTVLKAVHVLALDTKNNYYVTPTNNATAMSNSIAISTGKLAVSKTNDVQAGNVPTNSSNVPLATFNFKVTGEPIEIRTLTFRVSTTGTVVPTGIDSITLYNAAGKALIGGVDGTGAISSLGYATTTDSFVLPVGDNILTVKAKIDNTPLNNDTVRIDIDMSNSSNFDARGTGTGDTVTLGTYATPNAFVTGNNMTIRTAQIRVTTLATPASTTVAGGQNDLVCAQVALDAFNSSEDLKVTQFQVIDTPYSGAKTQDIQNIRLFVNKSGDSSSGTDTQLSNTQSGSTATVNTAETITFNLSGDDQFIVKAGKRVVVTVKCNVAGGATAGTHRIASNGSSNVTVSGVSSGSSVTPTVDTSAQGQGITVGVAGGTVQVSLDAANPASSLMAAGTNGVTLGVFNFYSTTTEDVEVRSIYFTQRVTNTNSAAFQDYVSLYVVDSAGNTVGSASVSSTKPVINLTSKAFVIDRNNSAGKTLYLKANLSPITSTGNVQTGGHQLGFNIAAAADVLAYGNQTGTASVVYLGATAPNGNTHYMFKGVPTVTPMATANAGKLSNGQVDLFQFQVAANTSDIDVCKFSFDITTTTARVTDLTLVDMTDTNPVTLQTTSTFGANLYSDAYLYAKMFIDDTLNNTFPGTGCKARTVSVSKPRIFVLRGTVAGAVSGATVATRLIGDSAPTAGIPDATMRTMWSVTTTEAGTVVNNDFIWSDRSAGGHSTSTLDWTNGYVVPGLNGASSTPNTLSL